MMTVAERTTRLARIGWKSITHEGLGFVRLWPALQASTPGWLDMTSAQRLYALAHHGPQHGAIVEIGSAWGRSTICLATGSKRARREKVYAIDPHSGDPDFLEISNMDAFWPPPRYIPLLATPPRITRGKDFNSFAVFEENLRRFGVRDWVQPIVETSHDALEHYDGGPIRLLFVDGLHTYEGVKTDLEDWIPLVTRGGIIVLDDYNNKRETVGVRRAVDEFLGGTNLIEPIRNDGGMHVWTRKL